MKFLRMHFCHPIKGVMRLFNQINHEINYSIAIDSKDSDYIEVPLQKFIKGKYKIELDWEFDGRYFNYEKFITIS